MSSAPAVLLTRVTDEGSDHDPTDWRAVLDGPADVRHRTGTRVLRGLFGWTAGDVAEEFGGYFMFFAGGAPVAGCMPKVPGMPGTEGPDSWGVYLSSADAKGTVDTALAHGGTLRDGPMDIADLGVQAIITDDTGARIGVWQAKSFPGISASAPVGTPSYFELITRDYAKSVAFYTGRLRLAA